MEHSDQLGQERRILIVDDEENILKMLKDVLTIADVEVTTTTTVKDAISFLEEKSYQVTIIDIRLAGSDEQSGMRLLDYIQDNLLSTEVIIMTGYGSFDVEQEAYSKGAYFYCDKPVDLNVLIDMLKELGVYNETEALKLKIV